MEGKVYMEGISILSRDEETLRNHGTVKCNLQTSKTKTNTIEVHFVD